VHESKGISRGEKNLETVFLERRSSSIPGRWKLLDLGSVKMDLWGFKNDRFIFRKGCVKSALKLILCSGLV